ncbi:MAG TPA: serine/threonine-protein kinase [Nannocystaceae bacterium]|nr:serine/threonine-protein kinase [Nannocystaceae bacterium]
MRTAIERRLFDSESIARIGRFLVLDVIGRGGMGTVYRAYDPRLDRRVAVKVLRSDLAMTTERLEREAQALARLSHPNVVTIHEIGDDPAGTFVAMELVEGGTLAQWCRDARETGRERVRRLLAFALQACDGLIAAHELGLVHRDLKPANMLVGRDGRLRLADFGLVALESPASTTNPRDVDIGITASGELIGTLAYMAPEQLEGRADARSDQFSLCASFYEALFATRPYGGSNLAEIRAAFDRGVVERASGERVPEYFVRALLRGLAVDPRRRFATVVELRNALARGAGRRARLFTAVALGGTIAALTGWQLSRPPVCELDPTALDPAWDASRRAAVQQAFAAVGERFAPATLERIEPKLDRVAARWAEQHVAHCRAERAQDTDPAALEVQTACLEHARTSFDTMTAELAQGERDVLLHAVDIADLLLDTTDCTSPLAAEIGRERGGELIERLQRGRTAMALARYEEAETVLASILADTERGELPLVRTAAAGELVGLYNLQNQHERAVELAELAIDDAELGGDHDTIVRRWAVLAATLDDGMPLELARFAYARARRLAARAPTSALTLADLDWKEGNFLTQQDRFADAMPLLERASEVLLAEDSPRAADALGVLAMCRVMLEDTTAAIATAERALAVSEAHFGSEHPEVAQFVGLLADVHGFALDEATSEQLYTRALAIYAAHPTFQPSSRAATHRGRALARINLLRPQEALADYDAALRLFAAMGTSRGRALSDAYHGRAVALRELGRVDEALQALDASLRVLPEPLDTDRYMSERLRAQLLATSGRRDEANAAIDRAAALEAGLHEPGTARDASAGWELAGVLNQLGRTREAIALLETRLARLDPSSRAHGISLRVRLGESYRLAGDLAGARAQVRAAESELAAGAVVPPFVRGQLDDLAEALALPR